MKNIIPKDTRYIPFVQQHACCVPTSISVIMYKNGIPLVSQELLGYHLGLILDKEHKNLFWNVSIGKRPPTGYGTRLYHSKYHINLAFKKLNIPLSTIEYKISSFKDKEDLIDFINKKILENKDLMVFLASDVLNDTNNKNGHACVIDRIYPTKNMIRLVDPSAVQAKWREIKINKFIKAVKSHPTGNGRFLEFKKI